MFHELLEIYFSGENLEKIKEKIEDVSSKDYNVFMTIRSRIKHLKKELKKDIIYNKGGNFKDALNYIESVFDDIYKWKFNPWDKYETIKELFDRIDAWDKDFVVIFITEFMVYDSVVKLRLHYDSVNKIPKELLNKKFVKWYLMPARYGNGYNIWLENDI